MAKEWKFNPQKQIDATVDWIKEYFAENGGPDTKAVIGISGGKDSTIAAALLVRALGPDRVVGVMMPCGVQADIMDSQEICDALDIEAYTINVGEAAQVLYHNLVAVNGDVSLPSIVTTNTPARLRMTTLYAVAGLVGGRVVNTGNWSEGWIGYTTKYGDLAGDFHLFQDLTVREVLMMGRAMDEIPRRLVDKTPADGMSGKTDEDNMGVTYEQIDAYLLEDIIPDAATFHNMKTRHNRNTHKRCVRLPGPRPVGRYEEDPWAF